MSVDAPITFENWKKGFLSEIDALPNTVLKGNAFVESILRIQYSLSEDDAADATESAGAGDKGVDAIQIIPAADDSNFNALVVQGKYGTAGAGLKIYDEAQKFFRL